MSAQRPMTDKEKHLLVAFKLAMEAERKAQVEYGGLAAMSEDPEVRGVFERLEREEAGHEEELLRLYRDFKTRFVTE